MAPQDFRLRFTGAIPCLKTLRDGQTRNGDEMAARTLCLAIVLALAACTEGYVKFPVTREAQQELPANVEIIRLDETNIASFARPARPSQVTALPQSGVWDYRVGVGDILNIIVFDHPELTLPAGPGRSAEESGFRVQADGTFFYPFVGQVEAQGRAPEDIREDLRTRLAEFIPEPQVEVRVAAFNSQSVVVTGEVKAPNKQPLTTVPLTLIEAVNAAGGLTEDADTRYVVVQRGARRHEVDLRGFLADGIVRNNPVLRPGDVVNVPRRRTEEAYLLGQIGKPAAVDLSIEPVTLTQAVTRQGGLDELRADARGVFVFRGNGGKMTVFQLDTTSPAGLLMGTRFVLQAQDVVYVTRSPLQRWNDTISRLLPTVQAVDNFDDIGR